MPTIARFCMEETPASIRSASSEYSFSASNSVMFVETLLQDYRSSLRIDQLAATLRHHSRGITLVHQHGFHAEAPFQLVREAPAALRHFVLLPVRMPGQPHHAYGRLPVPDEFADGLEFRLVAGFADD